ncbi:MAG: FAD-dependent oxidoreductase [Bacteroidales bacterium]
MKAIVIGSGVGGLAMAIRLAVKGYEVHVFEKNGTTGGKIGEIRRDGFRFDTGPSLLTLPSLLDELFLLAGRKRDDRLPLVRLDMLCRYFYEDGTEIDAWSEPRRFAAEVEQKPGRTPGMSSVTWTSAGPSTSSRPIFSLSLPAQGTQLPPAQGGPGHPPLSPGRCLPEHAPAQHAPLPGSPRCPALRPLRHLQRVRPHRAPATLNLIAHLEHNLGAYLPATGMREAIRALEVLARELGVHFHLNSRVEEILTSGRRVRGIRVGGGVESCDRLVSDADIHHLYRDLLPGKPAPAFSMDKLSSSALIFYWGVRGHHPRLEVHNILFSTDYKAEFRSIFNERTLFQDPTVYLYLSSRVVPGDAPGDGENWFAMINVPPDTGQDWTGLVNRAREHILDKIRRMLSIDLRDRIVCEDVQAPPDIEQATLSWKGALYGQNSNSPFAAFLRHPYRHRTLHNLHFVGGSVHPGGGIPLCLASAAIADREFDPVSPNPTDP